MKYSIFLDEDSYIDFSNNILLEKSKKLFSNMSNDIEKAKIAYHFVRDEIPHSFDINAKIITAKASDVLKYKTGICHAKANLLAALLRSQGIPTGFCYQHLTIAGDDSLGYCLHCYNAIYINYNWIKVDARGNTNGKNAQFSLSKPILAFNNRQQYNEYFIDGIYSKPHKDTMLMLENAKSIMDISNNIPEFIYEPADIL